MVRLNVFPETEFTDADFWNSETDLMNAANRMYQQLSADWIDNRGDDALNQNPNLVSNGQRDAPNTSGDWNNRYDEIFTANNILQKGGKADVTEAVRNRYFGEARFFRAYAYSKLVKLYGDVPLVMKTLDINSPELFMPRTPRQVVIDSIYADLDFAAQWLPTRAALPANQFGRVTKSTALALKARVALYEGTRAKYHADGSSNWQQHLDVAIAAAEEVMTQGHVLFNNYGNLFLAAGEGNANRELLLVKIFGVSNTNVLLGHNNSRDLENGRMAPTRNLIRHYLYADGLPAWKLDNTPSSTVSPLFVPEADEPSYNTILDNRDPRVAATYFRAGDVAYQGPWIPRTTLGSRTAFAAKKGFSIADQVLNAATVDRILIRYAEVLLILAEAKFERNGSISDDDLNRTINQLRTRAGFNVFLTNAFVTTHNLDMLEEIRRERTVELALEGFRYDDLIRWKLAEVLLPKDMLGAKYIESEWVGTNQNTLNMNADKVLIAEPASTRTFNPLRDYLYPVPINEITLSGGNVTQNPNW
ncbi:MAG: RagB/SusD family nutrient uptake outer membrane protein [Chitinophagaceae bacterium]|nr:RagB/SusD family nutrient uptake outer membrane protein [Chitinophagaceae bacterium]